MRSLLALVLGSAALLTPLHASATDVDACLAASERGQRARAAGKLREARDQFLVCSADACPALVRKDCGQWQGELAASMPTVVFGAKDKQGRDLFDVSVAMDGQPLQKKLDGKSVSVDPGPHTFTFETAGSASVAEKVLVKEGERARVISVTFGGAGASSGAAGSPSAHGERDQGTESGGRGHTVWPWLVVGAGVVTAAVGVVLIVTTPAFPAGCDADLKMCVRTATDTDASFRDRQEEAGRHDTQPVTGAVVAGAGGLLVVGGLLWHFLEPTGGGNSALRVSPWTSAQSTGVSLGGTF